MYVCIIYILNRKRNFRFVHIAVFIDYVCIVNRRQREIQDARACMVRCVPCSIRSICFTCLTYTVVK